MASITIVGTGFTGATQCFFGTVGVPINLNVAGTSFTCTPPNLGMVSTQGVSLTIYSLGGSVEQYPGYTFVAMPTVSSMGPTQGSLDTEAIITITGNNFYDRSSAVFPGVTLQISSYRPTEVGWTDLDGYITNITGITFTMPTAVDETLYYTRAIVITTPTGAVSVDDSAGELKYTYILRPILTSTNPSGPSGPLSGGTTIRVIGQNLLTTTGITMGGIQGATLLFKNALGVTMSTPPSNTAGAKVIQVTTIGGVTSSNIITFTYVASPTISSISPGIGPLVGGTTVTINGTQLQNPRFIYFGGNTGTNIIANSTGNTATVNSPAGSGTVNVGYWTAGGGATHSSFVYAPIPTITTVIPNRGPTGGG